MTDCRVDDAEVSAAPVPLSAALCVDSAPGIKSEGFCAVFCGSGSGRFRIILPDPHPADADPFQPMTELNIMFFQKTCVDTAPGKILGFVQCFADPVGFGISLPDPHPSKACRSGSISTRCRAKLYVFPEQFNKI